MQVIVVQQKMHYYIIYYYCSPKANECYMKERNSTIEKITATLIFYATDTANIYNVSAHPFTAIVFLSREFSSWRLFGRPGAVQRFV
tara:strand:+ start:43 stop:303 length:261 start_codon:yes stop_codon:yes gene_type:complete